MYAGQEDLIFSLLESNLKEVGSGKELKEMLTDFRDAFAADDPRWREKVEELARKNPNRKIILRILDELSEDTPGTDPGPAD